MNMSPRPLIQDLVKEAIAKDAQRAKVAAEGARQLSLADGSSKEASASSGDETITTDYAMKLAAAVEYATPFIVKAADVAPPEGVSQSNQNGHQPFVPGGQGHGHAQPPKNPGMQAAVAGAATQMQNDAHRAPGGPGHQTTAMTAGKGKVASVLSKLAKGGEHREKGPLTAGEGVSAYLLGGVPAYFGAQKGKQHSGEAFEGGVRGTAGASLGGAGGALLGGAAGAGLGHLLGGPGGAGAGAMIGGIPGALAGGYGGYKALTSKYDKKDHKEASAKPATMVDYFLQQTKVAEDAINPAKISAGAAVPPEASASGESGGAPVAGMPQGPRSLVHSNESAMNYKRNAAYGGRKTELKQYFNEPAMSAATDTTLQQAFAHTGEAGTKFASAGPQVKTAAARALLMKLADKSAGKAV